MEDAVPASVKVWEAHPSPYGVPYYYNPATKESRWTIPTGPLDRVIPARGTGEKELAKRGEKEAQASEVFEEESRQQRHKLDKQAEVCSVSSSFSSGCSGESGSEDDKQILTAKERAQQKVQQFTQLLQDRKVPSGDLFETWLPRLASDPRFIAVPKTQRKPLFQKVLQRMAAEQRGLESSARRHNRQAFEDLLSAAESHGMLDKVKTAEEAIAQISASHLSGEPSWQNTSMADKTRLIEALVKSITQKKAIAEERSVRDFRALLQEMLCKNAEGTDLPSFEHARQLLRHQPRWKALASKALRQRVYNEMSRDHYMKWVAARKSKADEEDDARLLSIVLFFCCWILGTCWLCCTSWGLMCTLPQFTVVFPGCFWSTLVLLVQELAEHRKRSRRDLVEQEVRALLQRKIHSPLELSWDEVRVVLQEERSQLPEDVEEVYLHEIFNRICDEDLQRRADTFSSALLRSNIDDLGPQLSFPAVVEAVAAKLGEHGDELLRPVPESELRTRWETWRRLRLQEAQEAFRLWLRQSEVVTKAARDPEALRGEGAFHGLCEQLETDKRYMRLEVVPTQRRNLIISRLQEIVQNSSCVPYGDSSDTDG